MIAHRKGIAALIFLLLVMGWGPPVQAQVPSEYQALYSELETLLAAFESRLDQKEIDQPSETVTFGMHLPMASSNRGESLLAGNLRYSLQWQLDALKTLAVPAVYVEVNFPLLARGYHENDETLRAYEDFYAWLGDEIRGRGIKLIVKSQANFTSLQQQHDEKLREYYQGLEFEEYKQGRAETAVAVASIIRPDYLVVQVEPDTEEAVTGQPVNNVFNSVELIQCILGALETVNVSTKVGAGLGTWHREYQLFAEEYTQTTNIDFLDLHVYPINYDFLERIDTLKEIAAASDKKIAVSEAWLYKSSDMELLNPAPARFISRDPYSFWAPLDARFLVGMTRLARHHEMEYFSPFWSNYLSAYLNYDEAHGLPAESVSVWLALQSFVNWLRGDLTESGTAYLEVVLNP